LDSFPPYPEPEETGKTLVENSLIKARTGFRHTGILTIADDTGLEVPFLNGRPGVHSARYAGEKATYSENVELLLRELDGVPPKRRQARFVCVMSLVADGVERWWEGVSAGTITESPIGEGGFGYDPVFLSDDLHVTFAQADPADKNRVSHRGRALQRLLEQLSGIGH